MKRISLVLSVLMVVFCSSLAVAAEETTGFYAGVLGGYVMPRDATITDKSGGPSQDYAMDKGYLAGIKMGYIPPFAKYLAAELEYNYVKSSFDNSKSYAGTGGSYTIDGSNSMNAFFFNIKLRYPEGSFHPYVGIGPGYSWFKQDDITISGQGRLSGETSGQFAYQILAGLDYDITKNWGVGVGYKYIQVKPSFGGALNIDMDYKAHVVTLGVNFSF